MIRIVTDSTCDIDHETMKKLGVTSLPLRVNFGDEEFRDGIDISNAEFYEKLATVDKLPTTSQISPGEFSDLFRGILNEGDDVVGIFISSQLSGTAQSAVNAANLIDPERVKVVDSMNATMGLALLVFEAVKMRDKGMTAAQIHEKLEELKGRVRLYALVGTLKYLKMGGRLSTASAVIGGILNIVPLIEIREGKVEAIGSARGRNAAVAKLIDILHKMPPDYGYSVIMANSGSQEEFNRCYEMVRPEFEKEEEYTVFLGSIVGTHVGPEAFGFAYIEKYYSGT